MTILIGDDGMPQFTVQEGVDYDGSSRFMPPAAQTEPFVTFYGKAVPQGMASLEAGRPVHKSVLFVRIQHAGERDYIDRQAQPGDAQRWPRQYNAFREKRQADGMLGTPLDVLFPAFPDTIETLRYNKVYTVEQLAGLSDTAKGNIGLGADEWQKKAARYLELTNKGQGFAHLEHQVEKLTAQNERMQGQNASLLQQVGELTAKLASLIQQQQTGAQPSPALQPRPVSPFMDPDAPAPGSVGFQMPETKAEDPTDAFIPDFEQTEAGAAETRRRRVIKQGA
jgi:hypothetical protein